MEDTPLTEAPVLVAVDGSEGTSAAIRYAAAEAHRLDAPLRLIHVVPDYLPVAALMPLAPAYDPDTLRAVGRDVLHEYLEVARALYPDGRVDGVVVVGQPAAALVEAAHRARLIVLGSDQTALMERIAVGSVVSGVSARATVPVVTVPAVWRAPQQGDQARVVVGVKRYDAPPAALLRSALRLAAERDARVEVVHVWEFPATYGDLAITMIDLPAWQQLIEKDLREACAALQAEVPGVEVTVTARCGQAAQIIAERAQGASMLVIARRAHAFPVGHFGSTGRALLHHPVCPVEVLPIAESASATESALVPEQRSALSA
jgi:nucleotide-binding universal stress UspA family protein